MNNKVALFGTYCDTKHKQETLLKNIRKVKSLGLDVFVISILELPSEIHEEADYVIYSKENPVPPLGNKSICSWRMCEDNVKVLSFLPDYGYPSLLQLKRLIDFSSTLDYDYYFTMIYDIIITPEIERILIEGRECSFFKNPKVTEVLGSILTAFDKKHAKKFSSLLTEKSYYRDGESIAESWMVKVNDLIGGNIENVVAADSIDLNHILLETNHSPFPDFNLFIVKNKVLMIFLYSIKYETSLTIRTNISERTVNVNSQTLIHISDDPSLVKYIKIIYNGRESDLSNYFNLLKRSDIENYKGDILLL